MLRLTLSLASLAPQDPASFPAPMFQPLSFESARAKAVREKKPFVVVDFFATWYDPGEAIAPWTDEDVRSWIAEHAVAIRLDGVIERALAARFGVRAYPTRVFARADGSFTDALVGHETADEFLHDAWRALAGRTELDDLDDAVKARPDDVLLRVQRGRLRAERGLAQGATEDLVLALDAGFARKVVHEIAELGASYPPALDALRVRAAKAREVVESGRAEMTETLDAVWMSLAVGEEEKVMELVRRAPLAKADGIDARRIAMTVIDDLVERQRFDSLSAESLAWIRDDALAELRRFAPPATRPATRFGGYGRSGRGHYLDLCEAVGLLLGAGHGDEAAEIAVLLLEQDDWLAPKSLRFVLRRAGADALVAMRRGARDLSAERRNRLAQFVESVDARR
ncbi:MAG TPA: thioredoxin domain-containing protein [Planctomycetota bacterium]|nr:thioredoxin domain-containing protein [Planctomycetota bacterium]